MSLVEQAMAAAPAAREVLVREACGGDTRLFDDVWDCVQSEERMAGFLTEPLTPRPASEAPFRPGDLLEGRFHLLREVARGGMGIVYEAHDEKLERRVAVKCALAGFGRRLPPEVRHASEISHPNVCKIFEIHTAETPRGALDFLTMEFLEGETLAEMLRRGPLAAETARTIARQLCAGLAEAHHRQVIHGDLKSSNVIVTRDEEGAVRSVITDFGLARRPGSAMRAEQSACAGGTPDYMAPELWRGEKASRASDMYALGVILRELAAGQPALQAEWDRVIKRCLADDPAGRFAAADELVKALAPRSRRWMLAAAAAAVLAVATGVVAYRTAVRPQETVRLALRPLEAPPELAARAGSLTRSTAAELARLRGTSKTRFTVLSSASGATHALSGALVREDGALLVRAEVADVRSRTKVREWNAAYAVDELGYLPAALAGVVTGAFHLPAVEGGGRVNNAARADYEAGLVHLQRNSGAARALETLSRAVQADRHSPLTHAALAEAQRLMFQVTRNRTWVEQATRSLRQAERRNPDLAEVHCIAGLLKADTGWYEQAAEEYRRAIELAPANADAHRRLGMAYYPSNRTELALAAFRHAVELDPAQYKNHQALGDYYNRSGDYATAARYFQQAVERAPDEPAPRFALGAALLNAGRLSEAERELRRGLDIGETPEALNALAIVLVYQERDPEAIPYLLRAVARAPARFLYWMNLGSAYRRANRTSDAKQANRKGLALAEAEMRKDPRLGYVRACAAYLCARLGDRARAESEIAQAIHLSPNNKDVSFMAVKTYEALGRREDSLAILAASPYGVVADTGRHPELVDLRRDSRFQKLLSSGPN